MSFVKLQSRILAAAKLHGDMPPEQQAIMLSARGPGAGTCWTAMHKSPTELPQIAPWRMATALRLGATPDAGPRSTGALRTGNDGNMCKQSLVTHPFHPFCCQYGGATARPHRAVQCTLRRLSNADLERHVPELYDWVRNNSEAALVMRCAISDVVSWFPGVLQQLWIDVSVRCPHARRYDKSASKPGVAAGAGEAEKTKRRWYGRAVTGFSRLVVGWVVRAPSYRVIWWQRPRVLSADGGPSWSECC